MRENMEMPSLEPIFLNYAAEEPQKFTGRIETCCGKLSADQIWMRGSDNQNAIGNLILHLAGNVRQWILSGVGGEPDQRIRDLEFSARGGQAPADLLGNLRATVDAACGVIRAVPHAQLTERRIIQGHDVNLFEAILHVVEHFSGHTAQIIFITKMLTGEDLGFYSYLNQPQAAAGPRP